jgi:hypothetical protein
MVGNFFFITQTVLALADNFQLSMGKISHPCRIELRYCTAVITLFQTDIILLITGCLSMQKCTVDRSRLRGRTTEFECHSRATIGLPKAKCAGVGS